MFSLYELEHAVLMVDITRPKELKKSILTPTCYPKNIYTENHWIMINDYYVLEKMGCNMVVKKVYDFEKKQQ